MWRAIDQGVFSSGQGPAYEPWQTWRAADGKGPLALVRAAILAANPHNSQPWRFRVGDSRIDLFADTARNLGMVDPYRREMHIGLGCALENLVLAAEANGYTHQLALLPDSSDSAHMARINLSAGKPAVSELYQAIPNRHTNRAPYDKTRPVSSETLKDLQVLSNNSPDVKLFWFTTDADRSKISDLTVKATEAFIADKQQSSDDARWYRASWQDIQRYRDGITIDASGLPPVVRALGKIVPTSPEQNAQAWLQTTKDNQVTTAAAFGIIATHDVDSTTQQLQAGRLWQRMHLSATVRGLALQPLNQMPERAQREQQQGSAPIYGKALKELIDDANWQALMLFRIGYPTSDALASPRRDIEDVLG